jgi:hypothetical protein
MRRLAAVAGLAIAVAVVATAIAAPLTGNVAVNQNTAETQEAPRVALQPGGGFLVAWEERDLGNGDVYVRRFGADGTALTAAAPVATVALRMEAPDIDTAPDGSAVVTWTEGGTGDRDVAAQRLTAAGSPTGAAIAVDDAAGTQEFSRVAVSPDGTFTVVWADPAAASGGQEDIYMARYEADGDLVDDLAVVARADYQLDPDVAALPDGTLVVAFADRALGEVRVRRFEADGDLIGSEISVGADAVGFFGPGRPSVDADAGGFTVAWELDDTTFVRRFGANGAPVTGPVTVGSFPLENPFAATAPDGRSVVAWTAPDGAEAVLREYSATLGPDGGAQDVSASGNAGQPFSKGVAADAAGFVVAWVADDADDTGVYARRFSWGGGAASPTPTPTASASPVATQDPTPAPFATATPTPTPPKAAEPVTLADVVRGLPSTRRCVSRRSFRIRLREPKGTKIRRATVKVNGKLVATRKGKRVTAPVDLRGLPKGRFKVEIRVTTTTGRVIKGTRKYRTCAVRRK